MILGASQIDITPEPGVQLSGFAARIQPSVGVLDPLFVRTIYLSDGKERLLWLHADLVGFDRVIVQRFRKWAWKRLDLNAQQVMLSATHTHSGPCTIHLREAGTYDTAYVDELLARLSMASEMAIAASQDVEYVTGEGILPLAVDRRNAASAHTHPRVAAVGWRRSDNTFAAVLANYAMHPVALGSSNRYISADIPGQAALALARQLAGHPVVLITNGACGNLNPPAENVPFAQVTEWGQAIADTIAPVLSQATSPIQSRLRIQRRIVQLPLETLDATSVRAFASKAMQNSKALAEWGDKYRCVVNQWRASILADIAAGEDIKNAEAELMAVDFGDAVFLGANAEVFFEFADWIRLRSVRPVYLVGYANGDIGYLPTRAAYAEGGYEVEVAPLFYGGFRPKAGGLELLADEAASMIGSFR